MMPDSPQLDSILYLLLAGGQSRRMGGGDKNLRPIGGRPLLAHVIERAVPSGAHAILNANGDPDRYAAFDLPVVSDVVDGYAGPLAGILTGLEYAREQHPAVTHVLSLATDAPFLPSDLTDRLVAALGDGAVIAQAESSGRRHPVFAIWPVALADALRQAVIVGGVRKIDDFTAHYDCQSVAFAGDPDPFMNLNTPEDVTVAERWLSGR